MDVTIRADNSNFNYYGRWQRGATAITINSCAYVEFAYTGGECSLVFDVRGFTEYPAIFAQVDCGPIGRTELSRTVSSVTIKPAYSIPAGTPPFSQVSSRCHFVRFWVATHSLYLTPAAGKQWKDIDGGCKFLGIKFDDGELLPLPYGAAQVEFLGDSITQGLRLLYTGAENDTGHQVPYANWPQLTADLLGMKPVVTGFGGQGISASGTSGAPPATAAFPFLFKDVPWAPLVKPKHVVIYHGTNDGISAEAFEAGYFEYLRTIRRAYPTARIIAICPHNKGNYTHAIQSAVRKSADSRIHFLDYSSGVISAGETCDGCHLNPGGAIRLAITLAKDLK